MRHPDCSHTHGPFSQHYNKTHGFTTEHAIYMHSQPTEMNRYYQGPFSWYPHSHSTLWTNSDVGQCEREEYK